MTLRRWLLVGFVLAASASAGGCRHGCGERNRLCGQERYQDLPPARLTAGPAPSYSLPGYSVMPYSGPAVGTPVSAPIYAPPSPPNELPYPGGENIPNPGVPLSQGGSLPAPQPLGAPTSTPVGLPK